MLSKKESELINNFKSMVCDSIDDTLKEDIFIISRIMGDIECKFGSDTFQLMIYYYAGLIKSVDILHDKVDVDLLCNLLDSNEELLSEVNGIISENVYEKVTISKKCKDHLVDEFNDLVDATRESLAISE